MAASKAARAQIIGFVAAGLSAPPLAGSAATVTIERIFAGSLVRGHTSPEQTSVSKRANPSSNCRSCSSRSSGSRSPDGSIAVTSGVYAHLSEELKREVPEATDRVLGGAV